MLQLSHNKIQLQYLNYSIDSVPNKRLLETKRNADAQSGAILDIVWVHVLRHSGTALLLSNCLCIRLLSRMFMVRCKPSEYGVYGLCDAHKV